MLVALQLRHRRVLRVSGLVDLRKAHALQGTHQRPQRHAVRHGGDGLAGMRRHDVAQRGEHPVAHALYRLRALDAPRAEVGVERHQPLPIEFAEPRPGPVLPRPDADLAQPRLNAQRQAVRARDGKRRRLRARQVACVHSVEAYALQPLCQRRDLAVAVVGDGAVIVSVAAAAEVALRFRVADQIDGRHGGRSFCCLICFIIKDAAQFGNRRGVCFAQDRVY